MFIGYKKHRETQSGLLRVFYRDGVFYFLALVSKYPTYTLLRCI